MTPCAISQCPSCYLSNRNRTKGNIHDRSLDPTELDRRCRPPLCPTSSWAPSGSLFASPVSIGARWAGNAHRQKNHRRAYIVGPMLCTAVITLTTAILLAWLAIESLVSALGFGAAGRAGLSGGQYPEHRHQPQYPKAAAVRLDFRQLSPGWHRPGLCHPGRVLSAQAWPQLSRSARHSLSYWTAMVSP